MSGTMKGMTGEAPLYPLTAHQGLFVLQSLDFVILASLQLHWEWSELVSLGVTGYMKRSCLSL